LHGYPCGIYNDAMFAQVAVNVPRVNGLFDYSLPAELAGQVKVGCLVIVPFGSQTVQGVVTALSDQSLIEVTRPVAALLDPQPVITPAQLELAGWLSAQNYSSLAQCLDMMLPPGLSQLADTLYTLVPETPYSTTGIVQERLVALLQKRGSLRGHQIDTALPHQDWRSAARSLLRNGVLASQPILPPPGARPKIVRTAQLICPPEEARRRLANKPGRAASAAAIRRQAMVEFLIQEPWPVECSWVYAASGGNLADLQRLAEDELVLLGESEVWRDPLAKIQVEQGTIPVLTDQQNQVLEQFMAAIHTCAQGQSAKPHLLYGVTSSGKTEIYLRAVQETLRLGRQAIILVPEIALTPQTVRRFMARFPGQVGLVHSRLSTGERYDTWRRARAGLLPVIVGSRSALFTPLPDVGLIVIDECHDDSYAQTQVTPTYHAITTAIELARLNHTALLLGTATPPVSLYYQAQHEGWPILRLPDRIMAHRQVIAAQLINLGLPVPDLPGRRGNNAVLPLPPVKIVDMRQELKAGNRSIFSRALQEALGQALERQQQAILFLNRRGASTYVFCRDCGESLRCPRCSLPLTFHAGQNHLLCHICGYQRAMPAHCPNCGSAHIRQYGSGTERVESDLQALFPKARLLRWDAETTRQKDAHELILAHFIHHQADVLIGTQMLSKGLDLPLVTLVGAVLAEVGLNLPDFRAGERTFQLLTQVAGRAGRSPLGGQVILQTFQPEQPAIRFAARHDFPGFYAYELSQRRQIGYPPFSHLLRFEFRRTNAEAAERAAKALSLEIKNWIQQGSFDATEIIGPAPCFYGQVNAMFRWQIILRGPNPLAVVADHPLGDCQVEIDPPSLL
jgi:primosomal protein N' (replication factor Y) (superfamily II helicase)